jgi:opacity protein-like surface antigen
VLRTGSGNMLLQTPFMIHGFQPYVTAGIGMYRERLGTHTDTGLAPNTGGGVKIALAGPLRLRLDYRVFKLGSGAPYTPAHRLYAGLNLKF